VCRNFTVREIATVNSMSHASENLMNTVRKATWNVAACQLGSQIISLGVLATLYRLLSPDAFGLVAMVMPAIMLARLFSGWGLGIASVQDQTLTDAEQSALFYRGLKIAAIAAALLIPCSWGVGWFYHDVRARDISLALSCTLLLISLGTQHQARLERKLCLTRLACCRLGAQAIGGGAAIALALLHAGVWPLVVQQYAEFGALAALLWMSEPWRPRKADATGVSTRRFLRFGGNYTASSLMFWIATNADTLLIGRLGGEHVLGLYSQAFNLMMKPVLMVTTPVTSVMLPALARAVVVPDDFRKLLVHFFRLVGIVLLPCGVGLFFVAEDVMLLLGGETWRQSGILLRALAPTIIAQGFINIAGSVFASVGRADRLLYGSMIIALLLCQGFAAGWWLGVEFGGTAFGGALGVAVSCSLVTLGVIAVPYLWYCCATAKVPFANVLAALRRPALAAAGMGIAIAIVQWLVVATPAVRLTIVVPLGIVVYGALAWRDIRQTALGDNVLAGHNSGVLNPEPQTLNPS
jgi:O-antigen/teichoic acid export membrane protein